MRRWLLVLALAGCDDGGDEAPADAGQVSDGAAEAGIPDSEAADAGSADVGADTGRADLGVVDVGGDVLTPDAGPGCTPETPSACAYAPVVRAEPGDRRERDVTYTDITGAPRTVRFEVRTPTGSGPDTPLVVWSHGGSNGRNDPTTVGTGWGQVFARAGYASIAIAHPGRDPASTAALCEALELPFCASQACQRNAQCMHDLDGEMLPGSCTDGQCRYYKAGNWDRPHDLKAILDWAEAQDLPFDVTRLVYAGHSAGAGSTNMVAGATRQYAPNGEAHLLLDPRPLGFISCSPQGPGDDGFTEDSFQPAACETEVDPDALCLQRPHLTLTGVDDGGVGPSRRLSFDLAPESGRYLGYITEPDAQHTTFNYEVEGCERRGDDPERCAEYLLWLRSPALAFLDAVLREDAAAQAYLDSTAPGTLSGDAMEWVRR